MDAYPERRVLVRGGCRHENHRNTEKLAIVQNPQLTEPALPEQIRNSSTKLVLQPMRLKASGDVKGCQRGARSRGDLCRDFGELSLHDLSRGSHRY
jgi:hypothetical protein